MALERYRFNTDDPKALAADLDRLVTALKAELAALERRTARRYRPRPGAFEAADFGARFEQLCRVQTANGDVVATLPLATADDAGRSLLIDRMSASNALTLQPVGRQLVNGARSLALPSLVGAFPVIWDGYEWRTSEGQ